MKKLFAIILTLCLLGGACALAAEGEYTNGSANSPTTVIKTSIGEEFTLIIPPTVIIPFDQIDTELPVEVTNLRMAAPAAGMTRALCVRIASDSGKMTSGANELAYTLIPGEEKGGVQGLFFEATGAKNMTITIAQDDWNSAPAGSYSSTVTFSAAISDFAAAN